MTAPSEPFDEAFEKLAPGASEAARIGRRLVERAITYGGQRAGIAAAGLAETFKVDDSWQQRIQRGLAGARPALPTQPPPRPLTLKRRLARWLWRMSVKLDA